MAKWFNPLTPGGFGPNVLLYLQLFVHHNIICNPVLKHICSVDFEITKRPKNCTQRFSCYCFIIISTKDTV